MPQISLPLDISKPAHQILMEAINEENRTSFDYLDFDFGVPEPATLERSDINTKITITPKVGSPYYNSRTIYYRRMDLAEIYASKQIEIEVGIRTELSELIDEINDFYGINLTADDYVPSGLPTPDPLDPGARLTVFLQAKMDSVLFMGGAQVILNEAAPVVDNDNVSRKYYMSVELPDPNPQIYNKVLCFKSDLTQVDTFKALRNASMITEFGVDSMFSLSNGHLVLKGVFKFTANIGNSGSTAYDVVTVIIDEDGNVLAAADEATAMFGNEDIYTWYGHWKVPYKYIIDEGDAIGTDPATKLYRYTNAGVIDDTFLATGITYVPKNAAVDRLGRIYTVSDVYDDGGIYKYRIDRLNDDGTIDLTFSPVIMSKTGNGFPQGLVDIEPADAGGFYIMINNQSPTSMDQDNIPIINGVPIVPGNETQVYAWNPVIKFRENGLLDTTFANRLLNNAPNSVFVPSADVNGGNSVLAPRGDGVTFVTNKNNPITGYEQRMPMSFDNTGAPIRLSGVSYANMLRWYTVRSTAYQSNGKLIIHGSCHVRLTDGGWSTPRNAVAIYLKSGEQDDIIYVAPENAGNPVGIHNFCLLQQEY